MIQLPGVVFSLKTFSFRYMSEDSNWLAKREKKNQNVTFPQHGQCKAQCFPLWGWKCCLPSLMSFLGFTLTAYVTQPPPPPSSSSHHTFFHPTKNMKYAASKGRSRKKKLSLSYPSTYLAPECVSATQPQLRSGPNSPHKRERRANQQVKWAAPVLERGEGSGGGEGGCSGEHQWHIQTTSRGEFSSSPLAANFKSEAANAVLNYSPK